jgi:glutaredoxin
MRLLKFEKKNCPKCDMVQNYFDNEGIHIDEKYDVETSSDLDFIAQYVSMSLPVVVLIHDNGEVVRKSEGFNRGQLEEIVELLN